MNKYTVQAKRITVYHVIMGIEAENAEAARRAFHAIDRNNDVQWTDPEYGKAIVTSVVEWTD